MYFECPGGPPRVLKNVECFTKPNGPHRVVGGPPGDKSLSIHAWFFIMTKAKHFKTHKPHAIRFSLSKLSWTEKQIQKTLTLTWCFESHLLVRIKTKRKKENWDWNFGCLPDSEILHLIFDFTTTLQGFVFCKSLSL